MIYNTKLIYTAGKRNKFTVAVDLNPRTSWFAKERRLYYKHKRRKDEIYIYLIRVIFNFRNEITTHRAICFAGLHAARVIVPYTTRCVPLPFPPDIDLLQDFNIAAHTRRKLRPQMNQVGGPRTKPEIRWFLVVHLLQR